MNNNQCHREKSFPRSYQLLSYSLNSLSFTEHVGLLRFSPLPDSNRTHVSPITDCRKSLRTEQQCCQTQSTVYSQCHRPSVTPTFMKILHKHTHTHVYSSTFLFSDHKKENKNF